MDKEERAAWAPLIKRTRLSLDLDQQTLADIAGVSRNTIGNIERGKTIPQPDHLERILEALGLAPERVDHDVESFIAMLRPLLQRVPASERETLMPDLTARVLARLGRSA